VVVGARSRATHALLQPLARTRYCTFSPSIRSSSRFPALADVMNE
jgi:hypothetical protein